MRVFTTLLITVLAGCASKPAGPRPRTDLPASIATSDVDPVRLHNQLIIFADECAGDVAGTMSNIAAASRDRVVWEQSLLFKTRVIPLFYLAARQDDPREAFLDMWVMVVRMRNYLATSEERDRFGGQQHLAIAMAATIEARLLAMGEHFYLRSVIDDLKDEVESIAGRNPINQVAGITAVHAAEAAAPKEKGALGGILAIPLAPVTGVSGLKQAAGSIDSATRAFEAFTLVTQVLPEQIRWQSELLLLEIDSLDTVVKVREDLARLSASVESISRTAATLPQDVRREIDVAIEDAAPTIERLNATLDRARVVAEESNKVAISVAQAGDAWDKAAASVNQVLAAYKDLVGPAAPPADPDAAQPPSGLELLATASAETGDAAEQLRALLADLESGKLDGAVAQTALRLDGLVDRITWRAILVVAAFAASMVVYRLIVSRFAGSRAAGPNRAR